MNDTIVGTDPGTDLDGKMLERFKQLPKVVQDAITSADVEKRMRVLADTQKLHLDQWQALENEVMLALLGFQRVEDLAKNIQSEVKVDERMAATLASEVSKIVFEPIRAQLERELQHPDTVPQKEGDTAGIQATQQPTPTAPADTASATPTKESAVRAPISETYRPGEASSQRKTVHDDPYRESPL